MTAFEVFIKVVTEQLKTKFESFVLHLTTHVLKCPVNEQDSNSH